PLRNVRYKTLIHGHELGVKSPLGVQKTCSVDAIALPEAGDLLTDSDNRSRAFRAKQIRKLWLDAEHPCVAAFPLERIPRTHTRELDLNEHFVRTGRRKRKCLQL